MWRMKYKEKTIAAILWDRLYLPREQIPQKELTTTGLANCQIVYSIYIQQYKVLVSNTMAHTIKQLVRFVYGRLKQTQPRQQVKVYNFILNRFQDIFSVVGWLDG